MLWSWAATALAVPWAVPPDRAEPVRKSLASLWPGAPIEVVPLPLTGDGVEERDGQLRFLRDGVVLATAPASDPATEVVLVRSWSRNPEIAGDGWAPEPARAPEPVAPPVPEPAPPVVDPLPPIVALLPLLEPEPVPPPRRSRFRPAAIFGLREAFANPGFVDGFRVGARLSNGRWSAEITGFLATGRPGVRTEADRNEMINGATWVSPMDVASGSLAAQWSPLRSRTFALSFHLGVEARSYYSRRKPEVSTVPVELLGPFTDAGPELGVSLAWTPDPAVAIRLTLGDTLRFRRHDLNYGPRTIDQPRLWLDVILGTLSLDSAKDSDRGDNGTVRSPT